MSFQSKKKYGIFISFFGAVAQLGERRVRNAKVGSSILLRSTKDTFVEVQESLKALSFQQLRAFSLFKTR